MAKIRNPAAPKFQSGRILSSMKKKITKFAKGNFNNGSSRPPKSRA